MPGNWSLSGQEETGSGPFKGYILTIFPVSHLKKILLYQGVLAKGKGGKGNYFGNYFVK